MVYVPGKQAWCWLEVLREIHSIDSALWHEFVLFDWLEKCFLGVRAVTVVERERERVGPHLLVNGWSCAKMLFPLSDRIFRRREERREKKSAYIPFPTILLSLSPSPALVVSRRRRRRRRCVDQPKARKRKSVTAVIIVVFSEKRENSFYSLIESVLYLRFAFNLHHCRWDNDEQISIRLLLRIGSHR